MLQKARIDKNRDVKWKKWKKRTEEHFARICEYYRYLFVTVHLFTKTKNDKENVAIQDKAQSWHEDDRYAEGPRAHSFFSRVFYLFFFFGIFLPVEKREGEKSVPIQVNLSALLGLRILVCVAITEKFKRHTYFQSK